MARKRRKAPKILLHPMFRWIRGKVGKIVYRIVAGAEVCTKCAECRRIYLP